MESRQPGRLHVELVRSPDTVAARAEAVRAAGWRTSTWAPCEQPLHFERREAACDGVVIGEGSGTPLGAAAETTVLELERYPRPSQGSCSGERTTGILLVVISASSEDQRQALRDWGDFVHLRHIAEASVPGYRTITPWVTTDGTRFCHMYEMVGDDPQATFEQMTPLVKQRLSREDFKEWAVHPALVIEESRTYRRTA